MFRCIFRSTQCVNNRFLIIRNLGTSIDEFKDVRRINRVKLIGRVKGDLWEDSFEVSTKHKKDGDILRCFHRIKMENRTELPKNNDLIHINGELFHENKSKVDGIHIMQTHVLAKSVIILSNKVDMLDKESVNEVKLLGKIGNKIQEGNFTAFSVVTYNNSTRWGPTFRSDWHSIRAFDENLCDYIKTNLKISDWVLINGTLRYQQINLDDGKRFFRSYIEVKNIQKLAKRADVKQPDHNEN